MSLLLFCFSLASFSRATGRRFLGPWRAVLGAAIGSIFILKSNFVQPEEDSMGLEKLISLAALLAVLAGSTGQLPRIIYAVHMAELNLLKRSQSSS